LELRARLGNHQLGNKLRSLVLAIKPHDRLLLCRVENDEAWVCCSDLKHGVSHIKKKYPVRRFHLTLWRRVLPDTCRLGQDLFGLV